MSHRNEKRVAIQGQLTPKSRFCFDEQMALNAPQRVGEEASRQAGGGSGDSHAWLHQRVSHVHDNHQPGEKRVCCLSRLSKRIRLFS
jgi:hypothetical protein